MLLQHSADIRACDNQLNTPLHFAAQVHTSPPSPERKEGTSFRKDNHLPIVQLLVKFGSERRCCELMLSDQDYEREH